MVSCTSRRFQRWFLVDSELHTAQSYAHTVNNTVHTVPYDAYAYDRMIFFGYTAVCEDPSDVSFMSYASNSTVPASVRVSLMGSANSDTYSLPSIKPGFAPMALACNSCSQVAHRGAPQAISTQGPMNVLRGHSWSYGVMKHTNSRYKEVQAHPKKIRYNLKFVVSKVHFTNKFSILGLCFRSNVKPPRLWPLALTSCSILAAFSGFSQAFRARCRAGRCKSTRGMPRRDVPKTPCDLFLEFVPLELVSAGLIIGCSTRSRVADEAYQDSTRPCS
jgi:hypothetical protein